MDGPALRAHRGALDQAIFAAKIGVTVEHLSRMENGRKPVGPAVVRGIALLQILDEIEGKTSPTADKLRAIATAGLET
jgi:DNA-binding transcriptional regulator YiaG